MRRRGSIFVLLLLMLLVGGMPGQVASEEVPRMSVEELRAKLGDPQVVVLDVRSGYDWQRSQRKIVGAVREDPANLSWMQKYDQSRTIVLYCT